MTQSDKQAIVDRAWKQWRVWVAKRNAHAINCAFYVRNGLFDDAKRTAHNVEVYDKHASRAFALHTAFCNRQVTA